MLRLRVSYPHFITKTFYIFKQENIDIRLVGGVVRDIILGVEVNDYDMAVSCSPEMVISVLNKNKVHYITTGIKFGTVTAIFGKNEIVEITTLRIDSNHDGRYSCVEFTNNWELDAQRRDFTMNAMYMDDIGVVFDYFGGYNDTKASLVRFIGNAVHRIEEDYLRILRYFRFLARFGTNNVIDNDFSACVKLAGGLSIISKERITSELKKILNGIYGDEVIVLMAQGDVLRIIFGIDVNVFFPKELEGFIVKLSVIAGEKAIDKLCLSRDEERELNFYLGKSLYLNNIMLDITTERKGTLERWEVYYLLAHIDKRWVYNYLIVNNYIEFLSCLNESIKLFSVDAKEVINEYGLMGKEISSKLLELELAYYKSIYE